MPTSYQEMASASNWAPCPPTLLPFDILAYGDLLQVSWTYRSLTLVEGRPDLDGVHVGTWGIGIAGLQSLIARVAGAQSLAVRQAGTQPLAVRQAEGTHVGIKTAAQQAITVV